jgi:TonB-linked SusC/RagA family outer membrane protein
MLYLAKIKMKKKPASFRQMMGRFILLLVSLALTTSLFGQGVSVNGKVTNVQGESLPGVNVQIRGTQTGTTTDSGGLFTLSVPGKGAVIIFSFVGYQKTEMTVGDSPSMQVILKELQVNMEEVVVVAYGTSKRAAFTGSASFVDSKSIEKVASSNISNALQGLSPGLQVVSNAGKPGAESEIQIRGFGSINASNKPLVILDGNAFDGPLSSLATNEIKSISVLKDAASTSLYGSRAANGVILITTKSGTTGKPVINVRTSWGTSDFAVKMPRKLNATEQYEAVWDGFYYDNLDKGMADDKARQDASNRVTDRFYIARPHHSYLGYDRQFRSNWNLDNPVGLDGKIVPEAYLLYDYNWYDVFERKLRQEYSVDVSTALSEKTSMFFATSYFDDQGQFFNQDYKRWSTRLNLESKINDWLNVKASMFYVRGNQNDPGEFTRVVRTIPQTIHPYEFNHETGEFYKDAYGNLALQRGGDQSYSGRRFFDTDNPFEYSVAPYESDAYAFNVNSTDHLINNLGITAEILEGLTFSSNFSLDFDNNARHEYRTPVWGIVKTLGSSYRRNTSQTSFNWNNLLNYTRSLGRHTLSFMAGNELYGWNRSLVTASKTGLAVPGLFEIDAASSEPIAGSRMDKYRLVSGFARAEYNFSDRVYLSGSYRADGSSRFHPDNRWGSFWSVGTGWRLSEEKFLKDIKWIDNLKLKASYGTTGNDQISLYAYQALYDLSYSFYGNSGAIERRLPTPGLGWEKNIQFNTGFEFAFFNRFRGNVEFFVRQSEDLLFARPLPQSFGITSVDANIAKVQNTGFEMDLSYRILNKKELTWNISASITHFKNKIMDMPLQEMFVPGSTVQKWVIGKSIYEYWTPEWAGVDSATGKNTWYKNVFDEAGNVIDRVPTTKWNDVNNEANREFQGSSLPDFFGSVTNTFSYKGFDFSFMFYYSIGGIMVDNAWRENTNMRNAFGLIDYWLDNHWTPENPDARIPRPSHVNFNDNGRSTDQFMFNNDFLRLKTLNLGYTIPSKITNRFNIKVLRLFAQADNLFTWGEAAKRGTDPEIAGFDGNSDYNYGIRKMFVGGIQFTF